MRKGALILFSSVLFTSCVIKNPKPEECYVQNETIIGIKEGSTIDIVFKRYTW